MYKSSKVVVYDGEKLVGELEVYFNPNLEVNSIREKLKGDKIRISYYTTPSERCSPLAVLHTLTSSSTNSSSGGGSSGVRFKLESNNPNSQLMHLHSTCLTENKTAVASLGGEELHLVAMRSRRNGLFPCFWGFIVQPGLYESCLVMLNLRCLGIVFDLDETLIVANTLRSFEDRIEALQRKVSCELDPQRLAGMLSEIKRYQDDRNLLKQYAESDQVIDSGKLIKAQSEVVPALSDSHQSFSRPLIRLPEKNIILTRINPTIRDTSVLVRLRPAWEDLRSYLMARGPKHFEVYVCTMAERDYALEMWRLLDPDSNLIRVKELLTRVVCVKSGLKKSLYNVFQDGNCHPKMALVIDDHLEVWDERDQPRVHVVPAFAPYYAPQAEANSSVPILCVARNIGCNVRGGFFKDFDDSLLQRVNEVAHEDDIKDILPPDVSNYLISEDDASNVNGSKEPHGFDGMADAEVERRLKEAIASATITPVMPRSEPETPSNFIKQHLDGKSCGIAEQCEVAETASKKSTPHEDCPIGDESGRILSSDAYKIASKYTPSSHHFIQLMKNSHMTSLYVPANFAKHLPSKNQVEFEIRNKDLKSWTIKTCYRKDKGSHGSHGFSAGWTRFVRDNDIKVGDVLIIELDGVSELKVLILRVRDPGPAHDDRFLPLMKPPRSMGSSDRQNKKRKALATERFEERPPRRSYGTRSTGPVTTDSPLVKVHCHGFGLKRPEKDCLRCSWCTKNFCIDSLVFKFNYTTANIENNNLKERDWVCPSCKGDCRCKDCKGKLTVDDFLDEPSPPPPPFGAVDEVAERLVGRLREYRQVFEDGLEDIRDREITTPNWKEEKLHVNQKNIHLQKECKETLESIHKMVALLGPEDEAIRIEYAEVSRCDSEQEEEEMREANQEIWGNEKEMCQLLRKGIKIIDKTLKKFDRHKKGL